jgi:prephenate dehydrogenase
MKEAGAESRIAIIGLGLMGGSLALALRAASWRGGITGIARSRETLDAALAADAIDVASDELAAAREADIIVLAAPVRTILEQIPLVGELAGDGALLLDMGSTKRAVVEAMDRLPTRLSAVGGHPMCGKETSGFASADGALYRDKLFILAPTARTTPAALAAAQSLAEIAGARVKVMDAARHDEIVAAVSHLPYVVASALVTTVADWAGEDDEVWRIAASGFRDTSRLAASDVTMMLDILLTNSENVADLLRRYSRALADLADAIYDEREELLRERLEAAAARRREEQAAGMARRG